jgi:hypothetical protein
MAAQAIRTRLKHRTIGCIPYRNLLLNTSSTVPIYGYSFATQDVEAPFCETNSEFDAERSKLTRSWAHTNIEDHLVLRLDKPQTESLFVVAL